MILKTVAYVSRGTILETFLKQHYLYEKIRYLNGKIGFLAKNFNQSCQRRISRVQCNIFEKMIKVNFTACGFFRTLCDFFTPTEKLALGVKTTN